MSTNYLDIEKALIDGYSNMSLPYPVSYPAAELSEDSKNDGLWVALHNMRGESFPVTLGLQGEDDHPGFFQIDINVQKTKGTGTILSVADAICSNFTAGKTLTYNTQEVKILSTSLSPGRYVGGFYRLSVTINYYARTTRN